jgi:hypothetical protein
MREQVVWGDVGPQSLPSQHRRCRAPAARKSDQKWRSIQNKTVNSYVVEIAI